MVRLQKGYRKVTDELQMVKAGRVSKGTLTVGKNKMNEQYKPLFFSTKPDGAKLGIKRTTWEDVKKMGK